MSDQDPMSPNKCDFPGRTIDISSRFSIGDITVQLFAHAQRSRLGPGKEENGDPSAKESGSVDLTPQNKHPMQRLAERTGKGGMLAPNLEDGMASGKDRALQCKCDGGSQKRACHAVLCPIVSPFLAGSAPWLPKMDRSSELQQ